MSAPEGALDVGATPAPLATQPGVPGRYGEIYDRGYQHYDGQRLGRRHAVTALIRYSAMRALGAKKRWTAKITPIILYVVAFGVALILIVVQAFAQGADLSPYSTYFGFLYLIVGLFVGTAAPEMLCGDRRENVLPLYFSRAITRLDYVLAKMSSAGILTLTITLIPGVLLWLFWQLLADSPISALGENIDDLGRVIAVGTLISFYLGSLALAVASFTSRKAIAVAVIIVGYGVTEALVNVVAETVSSERVADWVRFLSPAQVASNLTLSFFPSENEDTLIPFAWWAYVIAVVATIVLACAVMIWRYVPED